MRIRLLGQEFAEDLGIDPTMDMRGVEGLVDPDPARCHQLDIDLVMDRIRVQHRAVKIEEQRGAGH